ncbi:MAG: glycosyltransferase family 4 protein [Pseudomonadota bacterium]
MKILYHHRTASKDGQAVHIEEMIAALRGLGHEVIVAAPAGADDQDFGASNGWVDKIRSHLPKAVYELLELAYSIVAYRRLAALAREHRPDVLYERYNLYLLAGVWLHRRFKLPMLLEVNSPLAEERSKYGGLAFPGLARKIEAWTWRGADGVLPVTRVLGDVIEKAGVPAERIHVIPNGINPEHFAQAPAPDAAKRALGLEGRTVLGFTGFVRDWHGIDKVIDWMARHDRDENIHLLMVGDGPARADLEAQASRLGLADRVTFTGLVHRDRVPAMVAAFDIALQPAVTYYASPLKLFEYLALGCAIVAPRKANLLEVLVHDDNALMFDPDIPGDLELTLDRLTADRALRERLGTAAKHTIDRRGYTWRRNAERVTALFQTLAGRLPGVQGNGLD